MPDTEQTKPQHNAKAILQEALDTIKATYWITGTEFTLIPISDWEAANKSIDATLDLETSNWGTNFYEVDTAKAKVSGVCSIGALALANCTLYNEPLQSWDIMSSWDLETWKAGAALAMAILTEFPRRYADESDPGAVIASWNDDPGRTREEIVASFEKALDNPLLNCAVPYTIVYPSSYSTAQISGHLWFASETAARVFLGSDSGLRHELNQEHDSDAEWTVVPIEHDALVAANG